MEVQCSRSGLACLSLALLGCIAAAFPADPAPLDAPNGQCPIITSLALLTQTSTQTHVVTLTLTGTCLPTRKGVPLTTITGSDGQVTTIVREEGGEIGGGNAGQQTLMSTLSNGQVTTILPGNKGGKPGAGVPQQPVTSTLPNGKVTIIPPVGGVGNIDTAKPAQHIPTTLLDGKVATVIRGRNGQDTLMVETVVGGTATTMASALPVPGRPGEATTALPGPILPAPTRVNGDDDDDDDDALIPVPVPLPIPMPGGDKPPGDKPPGDKPPPGPVPTGEPTKTQECTTRVATSFVSIWPSIIA